MHSTQKGYYGTNYSSDYLGMLLDTRMNLPRRCRFASIKVILCESTLLPTNALLLINILYYHITMKHQHSVVCSAVSAIIIIIILLVVLAALFGGGDSSSNQGVEINDVVHDDVNDEVVPSSSSSSSSIPLPYETKMANDDNSRYSLPSSVSNNHTSNNITTSPTVKPTVITWRPK